MGYRLRMEEGVHEIEGRWGQWMRWRLWWKVRREEGDSACEEGYREVEWL
jgi:hypothetical protein